MTLREFCRGRDYPYVAEYKRSLCNGEIRKTFVRCFRIHKQAAIPFQVDSINYAEPMDFTYDAYKEMKAPVSTEYCNKGDLILIVMINDESLFRTL